MTMELAEQFRRLLRRVADGEEAVEAIATWAAGQQPALESLDEGPFKSAVQTALVRVWSCREGHVSDAQARVSLGELTDRVPSGAR